eukprot:2051275-Rhodomonas_salina.1
MTYHMLLPGNSSPQTNEMRSRTKSATVATVSSTSLCQTSLSCTMALYGMQACRRDHMHMLCQSRTLHSARVGRYKYGVLAVLAPTAPKSQPSGRMQK